MTEISLNAVLLLVHKPNVTLHICLFVPKNAFRFGSGAGVHEQYHTRGAVVGGVWSPQAGHPPIGGDGFLVC